MRWILILAVAACSSDKITALDGDLVIATMSKDDFQQFCTDFDHWADNNRIPANRSYECALDALDPNLHKARTPATDDEARLDCRAIRDGCRIKQRPPAKPIDCAEFATRFADCRLITVREFDECTHEDVDSVKQANEADLCLDYRKSFTSDDYIKFLRRPKQLGPKCQAMKDKCPNL